MFQFKQKNIILLLQEYNSIIMTRLAWDTDKAVTFSKETIMAAMILQLYMWKSKD